MRVSIILDERNWVQMNEIDNILDSAYCRCIYNKEEKAEKHLYRWKSWEGNTPFAPVYDVRIWLDDIDSSLLGILQIKNDLIQQNQELGQVWVMIPLLKVLNHSLTFINNSN